MKKVGAITIGQAPRTDILRDIAPILGEELTLLQAGALDGLTPEQVQLLRPDGPGNVLVSRLCDGTAVQLLEQKLLPLLQQKIELLQEQDVQAILFLCTGEFPEIFTAKVPLIFPSRLIRNIVASLPSIERIGVVTPEADQIEDIRKKWSPVVSQVIPALWNPYLETASPSACAQLSKADVQLVVMDCFGYSASMRDYIAAALGRPVILSRTIAARVLCEIV